LVAAQRPRPEPFRIAGYLPEYRAETFDADAARQLTDIILFSALTSPEGLLNLKKLNAMPWRQLQELRTHDHVRVSFAVGGWERSSGFPSMAASPQNRAAFVRSVVQVCNEQGLDGVDLDWEHPANAEEEGHYADVVHDLRVAFEPLGLTVSLTIAGWQHLPKRAFDDADWVQVMAYDNPGQHSTVEQAINDIDKVLAMGASPAKVVLGLPFYGRGVQDRDEITYADIYARYHPAADVDLAGGFYFNGPRTLVQKVNLAKSRHLGGVMIWEIGQDIPGPHSLLGNIARAAQASRP
jgi:chitinase